MLGSRSCLWSIELLALTLLVTGIFANHHDVAVAADDLALIAHGLDARAYLHNLFLAIAGLVPGWSPGPFLIQW